jgi:deoxyribonuclease V
MKVRKLHRWHLSCRKAVELQKALACRVQIVPLKKQPKLIAGLDCAFSSDGRVILAVVVVLKWASFEVVETRSASGEVTFPYIPGLLSFREAPACIRAVEKLDCNPDIFMVDGQGIAHPRRFGLASHLGLFFNKPTIGCAKSRLTGTFAEPADEKGSFSFLKDGSRIIGAAVRTRTAVKPVFVSIGNKCSLKDAIDTVVACAVKYRLPEPIRLAHQLVSKLKNQL